MATARSYGDRCGVARALDLVGERWALLIIRDLLLGPKRFTDLQAGLVSLSPDVLTQRLRDLTAGGVIRRRKLPPPASSWVYELTAWGRELEPTVIGLGQWGIQAPLPAGDSRVGADSIVLSVRDRFSPARADDLEAAYLLRLDEVPFALRVAGGALQAWRGEPEHADATIDTDPATLDALLSNERSLRAALRAGTVTVTGDGALVERFLTLFPAPAPQ